MDVLKQYLPLCWLKNNPLELPRSVDFFKQNLLFYFVVEYFMQANMTDDPIEAFTEVSIATLLTLTFIGALLFLNRTLYAYVQVTTAIIFCANIIALFVVPVLIWLTVSEDPLSYYFLVLLLFWDYVVVAHIIKQVLAINFFASLVLSLFYFIATYFGAFALGQVL
ncbi:hypothetical protein [Methylobacter tundripaludum]|uniref:Yip1 domain-containing protein n=1 Tax=Methylobacter tundripaludum (strain ATCC BAA-1195 / DSM 17260 / SV96) TaxID=697282 RepID=G3IUB9_METTV|nr:hypothetical protein [Methylobacter tundripaludum]EGW21529.1 hypothetical protein Mettu_0295 [Methylobacter tundripaludum SV96]